MKTRLDQPIESCALESERREKLLPVLYRVFHRDPKAALVEVGP